MGLPNRTTFLQKHASELALNYRVCSDGNVYRNKRVGRQAHNWVPDTPVHCNRNMEGARSYAVSAGGVPSTQPANTLRWFLITGELPNGERVKLVGDGLYRGAKGIRWAELPAPPGDQIPVVQVAPQYVTPGITLAELATATPRELCDLYAALVIEADSRKLNLQNRTIVQEVSV